MRRLRARQQTRSHSPHSTDSIDAGSRHVLAEGALVGDAADGLALGIVLGERRALAAERAASPGPARRAGSTAPRRRRSRAARRAARRRWRPASGSRRRAACSRRPDRCPGNERTGSGASTARSTPAGTSITPRGLASARRHLGHHLAGRDARARGQPQLAVDRAGQLEHRALDGDVAAVVAGAAVQALAAGRSRGTSRRCWRPRTVGRVAPGDLAHALGVVAVGVAAGRQVDGVGRQLARLDQRHARLHAQPRAPRSWRPSPRRGCRAGRRRRPACPPASDRARARPRRRRCRDPGSRSAAARAAPTARPPTPSTWGESTMAAHMFSACVFVAPPGPPRC